MPEGIQKRKSTEEKDDEKKKKEYYLTCTECSNNCVH